MLGAYSLNSTVESKGIIPFTSVYLQKGNTATLSGIGAIHLNKSGIYKITGYIIALSGTAGPVIIDMLKNGVIQTQDNITIEGATLTTPVTVPIDTFVQVSQNNTCCCNTAPTIIQFLNTGANTIIVDSKINISKIC